MLRALLAFLALLVPGPADVAVQAPDAPDRVSDVLLDAARLPGASGWFLVPVTVTEDAALDVSAWLALDARAPGRAAVVVVGSSARDASWALAALGSTSGDAAGNAVASGLAGVGAPVLAAAAPAPALVLREARESRVHLAGETLWLGLAATEWGGQSRLSLRVSAAAPVLRVGDVVTGSRVERVDLAEDARQPDAASARLARNVTRAWTPEGTGLLVLDASGGRSSHARLHVALPAGPLFAGESLKDRRVQVTAFAPGPLAVGLREVADSPAQRVAAVALYADLAPALDAVRTEIARGTHRDVVER